MRRISFAVVVAVALGGLFGSAMAQEVAPGLAKEVTLADGCISQEGAEFKDGKWVLPDGTPTYHVCKKDGAIIVDWSTYNGYRRYGECFVCHGPYGKGGSFAPNLANSLKTLSYPDFLGIVAGGRVNSVNPDFVMPAWGDNKNVMCFIDDLYTFLKARSFEALPAMQLGGRSRDEKPEQAKQHEKECLAH